MVRGVLRGAGAGAAGTTALDVMTYLDMAVRGRPASSTPQDTVEKLSQRARVPIPGDGQTRANRVAGLGPLSGLAAGVLKLPDLMGSLGNGIRGQVVVGSIFAGLAAYASVRFLVRWFETRTLWPFGVYCLVVGGAFTAHFA